MSDSITWGDYLNQAERNEKAKNAIGANFKSKNDELDKNAFLMLLITQMQYQDPMNPVSDQDFVAQMAQFSSLEQMQNLNQSATTSQAYSMVGKWVMTESYNEQTGGKIENNGRVDSVVIVNSEAYLVVNDKKVPMSDVVMVFEDEEALELERINTLSNQISLAFSLVGRYVQGYKVDDEENIIGLIEGEVEEVKLVNGFPVLVIGEEEVYLGQLANASQKPQIINTDNEIHYKNSDGEIISGPITNITVEESTMYLTIDDKVIELQIDKEGEKLANSDIINTLNSISDALKNIGKEVETKDVDGVVERVTIFNGRLYYTIDGKDVPVNSVKKK